MKSIYLLCVFILSSISPSQLFCNDCPILGHKKKKPTQISQLGVYEGYSEAKKGFQQNSYYVEMKDQVKLALDVYVPKKLDKGEKVPTIVYFVRYGRSLELKGIFKIMGNPFFGHISKKEVDFFTSHGYACVVVDLRGSGASFGSRSMEFSPAEVQDMSTVLDWICQQEWSNKKTATTGISYTGTTAELALSTQHPSLAACIPRSNIFDLYTDINFPGGLRQAPFVDVWKQSTLALDQNNFESFGGKAKFFVKGMSPVDGDKKRSQLNAAVKEHANNFDIFSALFRIEARDDVDELAGFNTDQYSIHNRIAEIEASGVPIYRISGWYDGANVAGVIKGYWNVKNTKKVLIGPWDHGPADHVSPFATSFKVEFDVYTEMLRFLDHHVKGIENGIDKEAPFYYFQMGREEFVASQQWPPLNSEMQNFYLQPNQQLNQAADFDKAALSYSEYICDYQLGSGNQSRWNSLTPLFRNGNTGYFNRAELANRMLLFETKLMAKDQELSGQAIADIYLSANATDASIYVYLEDISPEGKVSYITEGQFRAAHRKVVDSPNYRTAGPFHSFLRADMQALVPNEVTRLQFELLPVSYLLQKGHRLRISIAAADIDHFDLLKNAPNTLKIHHSVDYPSKVQIPFIGQ